MHSIMLGTSEALGVHEASHRLRACIERTHIRFVHTRSHEMSDGASSILLILLWRPARQRDVEQFVRAGTCGFARASIVATRSTLTGEHLAAYVGG
jgi:cytochrome bd-type quinol oxidase subunit 1